MSLEDMPRDQALRVRSACLQNARELLDAAQALETRGRWPNLIYSLATLALEETAKASLVSLRRHSNTGRHSSSWSRRQLDDHVKKLFWALWTPLMGREVITGEKLEDHKGLAKRIHQTRLNCTYVNIDKEGTEMPGDAVSWKEAHELLAIAKSRLAMEEVQHVDELPPDLQGDLDWLIDVSDEQHERGFLFSRDSMKKLAELEDVAKWISWLRDKHEEQKKEMKRLLEEELSRTRPEGDEGLASKWRMKIRLFSDSHSFRQSTLNWWNSLSNPLKLHQVTGRTGEMLLEFMLPKSVPLNALWWAGLTLAHRFIVSINIGTLGGFHFWYLPRQIDKYYEELEDLETEAQVGVERSPRLKIDWGKGALSKDDLYLTALVFYALPHRDETDKNEPFDNYLTGLGALAKTDIHLQFEEIAFQRFYQSLKCGMKVYKQWDQGTPYLDALKEWKELIVPDEFDYERLTAYGERIEENRASFGRITLKEVAQMKFICDVFFARQFKDVRRGGETGGKN